MIDSLPGRPLTAGEADRIDESSDSVTVNAVSVLYPEDSQTVQFEVYTLLVETDDGRHLVGYDESQAGWVKVWSDDDGGSYDEASENWMKKHYGERIGKNERIDANDFDE